MLGGCRNRACSTPDLGKSQSSRSWRSFAWSDVTVIRQEGPGVRYLGADNGGILLEGTTRLQFGTNPDRKCRSFVLHTLKFLKAHYLTEC